MSINYLLPNRISAEDFRLSALNWLTEGDYTPNDIFEKLISAHDIIFVPVYFYRVEYAGYCSASLGYQRQEYYYDWDNFNKRQIRKSRIVIDWQPYSQPVRGETTTLVYAGAGLDENIISFIENMGWAAGELMNLDESLIDKVENLCVLTKEEAWRQKGCEKIRNDVVSITRSQLPSGYVRNLNVNVDFEIKSFFAVAAPFWIYAYKYCGNPYYIILDANSPERISGIRPVNQIRRVIVTTIRSVGWSLGLALIIKWTNSVEDITKDLPAFLIWAGVALMIILFVAALIEGLVKYVKDKSKRRRESLLKQNEQSLKRSTHT